MLSEKNRIRAIELLNDVDSIWKSVVESCGKRINCAVALSVDSFTGNIQSEYAFFSDFISADLWISEKYNLKKRFCPFVQIYLNGRMHDYYME